LTTATEPLLQVDDLVKHFPARTGFLGRGSHQVHAVCGVSFAVAPGETLGLVGESGCGKSTTARVVLGILSATAGTVRFGEVDVLKARSSALRALHRRLQIVFQDPYASLDPRMTVGASIAEPLHIHRTYRPDGREQVRELMSMVELDPADVGRYPHQFSGGQRQRVGIARALALRPELLVLDEPISSLDVSIQAGVINLLADLQERLGVAYLFIAHDLSVIRHISHRVAVMYLGKLVETGTRDQVFGRPAHPYTQALLSAMPTPNPVTERTRTRIVLPGELPSPLEPPSGCRFRDRCWKAEEICAEEEPALVDRGQGHPVACHFAEVQDVL
jgi:peptide/nickel transport system ATP-binding protein/oligopeptide transport system ATP-binding protein